MRNLPVCLCALAALLLAQCSGVQSYALSEPQLLLPIVSAESPPVTYNITATGGCFTWSSRRTDIVTVEPVLEDASQDSLTGGSNSRECSRRAKITVRWRGTSRAATVVTAREHVSGHEIRCDVFVDKIVRTSIVTTSRTIYLEDAPEALDVVAFDSEGNKFNSPDNIEFRWKLIPVSNDRINATLPSASASEQAPVQDAKTILDVVNFNRSTYNAPSSIYSLESQGRRGHMILVKAIKSGKICVEARIAEPLYLDANIKSNVTLTVVERLMIRPFSVYLVPQQSVALTVVREKQNYVIQLPSQQYFLKLDDSDVASLDVDSSKVTGLAFGSTTVRLFDRNLFYDSHTQPNSLINVVEPAILALNINPYDRGVPGSMYVLEEDREYEMWFDLQDRDGNVIHPDNDFQYNISLDPVYFEILESSSNGSWHLVKTLKAVDTVNVVGNFLGLEGRFVSDPPVSGTWALQIFPAISVHPEHVLLPWSPLEPPFFFQLEAFGGSGEYGWQSLQPATVSVSSSGAVSPHAEGTVKIRAFDKRNTLHYGEASVHVLPPRAIVFRKSRLSTAVGSNIHLEIAVLDEYGRTFSTCRHLDLQWFFKEPTVFTRLETIPVDNVQDDEHGCLRTVLAASKEGQTQVTVGWGQLSASTTIYAYKPLTIQERDRSSLVTFGASHIIHFSGGPQPFPNDPASFQQTLTPSRPEDVRIYALSHAGSRAFRVVCAAIGCQTLTLSVGNLVSEENPFPTIESQEAEFCCDHPHRLALSVTTSDGVSVDVDSDECAALRTSTNPSLPTHHVAGDQVLHVDIDMYNKQGRKFNNHTTAWLNWEKNVDDTTLTFEGGSAGHAVSKNLALGRLQKQVYIKTNVVEYRVEEGPRISPSLPQAPTLPAPVFGELALLILLNPVVSPGEVVLFYHSSSVRELSILHGSGVFRVFPNAPAQTSVDFTLNHRLINVKPRTLGSTRLIVEDKCIVGSKRAAANVIVSDVYALEVYARDKVQVGHSTVATVCAIDSTGREFEFVEYPLIDIQARLSDNFIEVEPISPASRIEVDAEIPCKGVQYRIFGSQVGLSSVEFFAYSHPGHSRPSVAAPMQVFPPLQLSPRNIVLLPGSCLQVSATGGPIGGLVELTYTVDDLPIGSVNEAGLLCAERVGRTTLRAKASTLDSLSNQMAVFSEDQVGVEVVLLTGVKIFSPATRLLAGSALTVRVAGLAGETPFQFGGSGLKMRWSGSNDDVFSIRSVYHEDKVALLEEEDFAVQLVANHAGTAILSVSVFGSSLSRVAAPGAKLTDSLNIEIVEPLRVLSGNRLLLPLNSGFHVRTNYDSSQNLVFQVDCSHYEDLLRIEKQGNIITGRQPGSAVVRVSLFEKGFNQTEAVLVEVAPVAHISIHPAVLHWPPSQQSVVPRFLPIGSTAEFNVHLHDRTGRLFDSVDGVFLEHQLDRTDVVRVKPGASNVTFLATAAHLGSAILRVVLNSPPHHFADDYIRIQTESAIVPENAVVHVGVPVCFSTFFEASTDPSASPRGEWSSSNTGVVSFDSARSSIGRTLTEGTAIIIYHRGVTTYTTLNVVQVGDIRIAQELDTIISNVLTNTPARDEHRIEVTFTPRTETSFTPIRECGGKEAAFMQQIKFACSVQPEKAASTFEVYDLFDTSSGKSYCVLRPRFSQISDKYSIDSLKLVVEVLGRPDGGLAKAQALAVTQGFYLEKRNVLFTTPSETIVVRAFLPIEHKLKLEVNGKEFPGAARASDRTHTKWDLNFLRVKSMRRAGQFIDFELTIPKLFSADEPVQVVFVSELTGQRDTLTVASVQPPTPAPTSSSSDSSTSSTNGSEDSGTRKTSSNLSDTELIIQVAIIFTCIAAAYFGLTNSRPGPTTTTNGGAQTPQQAPQTGPQSPQSPNSPRSSGSQAPSKSWLTPTPMRRKENRNSPSRNPLASPDQGGGIPDSFQ